MFDNIPIHLTPEIASIGTLIISIVAYYLEGKTGKASDAAITLETKLRAMLRKRYGVPTAHVTEVGRGHIKDALSKQTDYNPEDIDLIFSDGTYLAPQESDMDTIQKVTYLTKFLPYRPERFDCEDFAKAYDVLVAFVLGVNSIGVVYDWSGGHAYNVIVTSEGKVRFIDPQYKEYSPELEEYSFENATIVF